MKRYQHWFSPHAILGTSAILSLFIALWLLVYGSAEQGAVTFTWTLLVVNGVSLPLSLAVWANHKRVRSFRFDRLVQSVRDLGSDDFEPQAEDDTADPVSQLSAELSEVQQRWRKRQVRENQSRHVLQALNCASIGLMVTDTDDRIVFVNERLKQDLITASAATGLDNSDDIMGKQLPNLSPDTQVSRALQRAAQGHGVTDMALADVHFRLQTSPVLDPNGAPVGSAIVWHDSSEEFDFADRVGEIVGSAHRGDLSKRIDVTERTGPQSASATCINEFLAVCDSVTKDTIRVLSALAAGDLTETIDENYEGAFGQLRHDANSTVERLRDVVGNIRQSSVSVSSAFHEINEGNLNLSQRTEQQAASLEEAACNMDQMTSTVQMNARNAQRANELAMKARGHAEKGGEVVGQAVIAMSQINEASKRIADIIGVIDEIAFQTNLLALNASVEAARAGEQGRGFAVVAGEVRNLAGRSAEAAKEIKNLINDSVLKVDNGTHLVDQSGDSLEEIMTGVKKVSDIVAEISAASIEQASGIAEVNATIAQMDDMTQQNAALVEQVASASELASDQARSLTSLIGYFSTGSAAPTMAPLPMTVPAERRAGDRPWSDPIPATAPVAATAAPMDVSVDILDDWEEF